MPARSRSEAVALGQLAQAQLADPVGGRLGAQVGEPLVRASASAPARRSSTPSSTRVGGITTPSSSSVRERAGIPAGLGPPMSAWWARQAAKPSSSPAAKTGEIRVTSGRWVPPR